MLTDAPQATASTLRPPVLQLPDAEMALEDNVAVTMEDEGWKTVTKKRKPPKPEQLRLERVSRPPHILTVRPLNKVNVHDLPKQAITHAIESTAPTQDIALMAIYRYDTRANSIRITVRDDAHAQALLGLSRLVSKLNGQFQTYEVQIERPPATRPYGCRGVIRVRPEHTLEYLQQHLRCESATILDMRILGKTGMLLLTFDAPELPPRMVLDFEVVHVYPYRPKLVACYNCHGLGHIARFCPAETVCRDCGRRHPTTESCDEEPFCAACCVPGHLSLNSACPSRLLQSKPPTPRAPPEKRNVTWAEVSGPPPPKPASSLPPEILQMMNDMRQENKRLHEENKRLHDQMEQVLAHLKVMGVPTPAPDVNKATQPAPGAGSRSRAHSRSRSRGRKTTASSQSHHTTSKQAPTIPLLDEHSKYTSVLNIIRGERQAENHRLERSLRDEFHTVTTVLQKKMQDMLAEIQKNILTMNDEPKRRRPSEAQ